MSESTKPTESAPESPLVEAGAAKPRRRRRRGPAAPEPDPEASGAELVVARARQLLERLVRGAGFGWRDIDRMIQKNRGFTAHLMSKREGLPLNELLAILDAIQVEYEDFFAVLLPQFDKMRHTKPIGGNMADLLGEKVVAEAPVEIAANQDERAHAVWGQLDKINALIDQRVLLLLESALAAPVRLPPRPETATPAADSKPALPEGAAGEGLV